MANNGDPLIVLTGLESLLGGPAKQGEIQPPALPPAPFTNAPYPRSALSRFIENVRRQIYARQQGFSAEPAYVLGFLVVDQPIEANNGWQMNAAARAAFSARLQQGGAWSECLAAAAPYMAKKHAGKVGYVYASQLELEQQAARYFSRPPVSPSVWPYAFELDAGAGVMSFDFRGGSWLTGEQLSSTVVKDFCRQVCGLSEAAARAAGEAAIRFRRTASLAGRLRSQPVASASALGGRGMVRRFTPPPMMTTKPATKKKPPWTAATTYARSTPRPAAPSTSIVGPVVVAGVGAAGGGAAAYYLADHSVGWAIAGALGGAVVASILAGVAVAAFGSHETTVSTP